MLAEAARSRLLAIDCESWGWLQSCYEVGAGG
jgi:hypothetical protein